MNVNIIIQTSEIFLENDIAWKKKKKLFEYTTAYLSNLLRYDNNAL